MINRRWLVLMVIILLLSSDTFVEESMSAIQNTVGAQSDATPPLPPPACTTFGFAEEAQLTLPTGFNNGSLIRVMKNGTNNIGYVVTDDSVTQRIAVFDLTSMAVRASATIQTCAGGQYRCLSGRAQGDIDTDSQLYLFQEANQGVGSCNAGANCIAAQRWVESATKQQEAFTQNATTNIDDARDTGAGSYLVVHNTGATRAVHLFSKSSLARTAIGSSIGSGFGLISRVFNGSNYTITETPAGATGIRTSGNSATSNGTFTVSGSLGTDLPIALYGLVDGATNYLIAEGDTGSGAQAQRAYVQTSNLVNCCTGNYNIDGTNGAAVYQGTFYDEVNRKVFSTRFHSSTGTERFLRTTVGPSTGMVIEENFNCVSCGAINILLAQAVDYASHKMRLFTVSSASPAVITRIRVCATGGPAA